MANEKATGLKSLAEGRSDMLRIDPRKINVKLSWNGRDFNDPANVEHVDMLAASIKEIGIKEPLTVAWEDGKAWLINGECRLRAVTKLIATGVEIKTVPVIAEDRYANEADKLFSQIARNSGKPFSQIEQANVFKRLLVLGWQAKDIADKAGVSPARVSQMLNLLTMPEPIKQMVTEGKVSASMAQATLKNYNPAKAVEVLKDAVAVAQAEGATKAMPKHVMQPPVLTPKPVEPKTPVARGDLETIVRNAFEYSDIDNNGEITIIKMPEEQWNAIVKALKL